MLKKYVQPDFFLQPCDKNPRRIFPQKTEICFYLRKELSIYDASMTTPQE